eukprot:5891726-Prymnesium_polylepis.1
MCIRDSESIALCPPKRSAVGRALRRSPRPRAGSQTASTHRDRPSAGRGSGRWKHASTARQSRDETVGTRRSRVQDGWPRRPRRRSTPGGTGTARFGGAWHS